MNMKRTVALLTIGAALTLGSATAGATLPLPSVGPQIHRFAFTVGTSARTVHLPGRSALFHLNTITVNGSDGTLYAEGHDGSSTVTLYGHGVILRFTQQGRTARIVAVGVRSERVVVRYWLG